ncbi:MULTISPECIES: outer membrane lipoprotein carrier protein LolA [Filomicrobium]|uniref:Outer membrane lipoprotein-sorting protein n=1 Tax=Filomicrobium insigne TaxID=418854 RepID=A0A1H0TZQ7_9HYPH|nr:MULTISPECIES: outer membrane lipoprotein carrier protein LolA [Filomicrobium]MCV0370536.1 outer membrane lipoprotein carrier protein LolA [Filomicrobium sp.]SDP59527.1 Outer membrane lipoprotein-sorting protein [Filomicrobium insigne]
MKHFPSLASALVLATAFSATALAADPAKNATATPVGPGWSAQVAPDGSSSIALDAQQTQDVNSVSKYFNELKTLKGEFVQTAADGKVMKGNFLMMRPGMFRFNYDRPSRQLIISDGTYLAIQDPDVDSEDRVALDQTPFRILLGKDVDLMRDARIVEVQQIGESLLLALEDKSPDATGRITLIMSKTPDMQLKEWITTDAQGLDTRVQVADVVRDEPVEKSKFVIKSVNNPFKQ